MKAKKYDPERNLSAAIGLRIRALRQSYALTQPELAALAGLPEDTVKVFEGGKRKSIGLDELLLLARALSIRPMELAPELAHGDTRPWRDWRYRGITA